MLVVMHFFYVQVLSGFKVHDVNVEVIVICCRQQLPEHKHLGVHREHWLIISCTVLEGGTTLGE